MQRVLKYCGYGSLVVGAVSVIAGFAVIQPRVNKVTEELLRNMDLMVQVLDGLEEHAAGIESSLVALQEGGDLIRMAPKALAASKSSLEQTADSLEAMAGTLAEASEGLTDIVAPETKQVRTQSRQTAQELKKLASVIDTMRGDTQQLARAFSGMTGQVSALLESAPPPQQMIQRAKSRVQETRASFEGVVLNWAGSVLSVGIGLIFVFLGVGLLALERIQSLLERSLRDASESPGHERESAA